MQELYLRMPLDIQMFTTDLKSTKTQTYEKHRLESEMFAYLDRTLEDAAYENNNFESFGDFIDVPSNNSKKVKIRKSGKYKANAGLLLEGVIPNEDDGMANYAYEFSIGTYGGYITYTDELGEFSINNGEVARLQRNQGLAVGEIFDARRRDILLSIPNRYFARKNNASGVPVDWNSSDLTDLTTIRNKVGRINLQDLIKMKTQLLRNGVKPYEDGCFVFLMTPEMSDDLLTLVKDNNVHSFIELAKYTGKDKIIYEGEIGKWNQIRFVVNIGLKPIVENSENTLGKSIHAGILMGKYEGHKAVAWVRFKGKGNRPQTIHKPLEAGGARENPLNQIGSIGWKKKWGAAVVYPEAAIVYECVSGDVENITVDERLSSRANLVGTFDKDGNYTAGTNPEYLNGITVGSNEITGGIVAINVLSKVGTKYVDGGTFKTYLATNTDTYETIINKFIADNEVISTYGELTSSNFYTLNANGSTTSLVTSTNVGKGITTIYMYKQVDKTNNNQ